MTAPFQPDGQSCNDRSPYAELNLARELMSELSQAIVPVLRDPDQMRLPRLSVVTPSYNQGAYLAQCLESIHSQGYPNVEHIVMDGGSTDNSVDVLKRFSRQLSYWQSRPDGGQSEAINAGFDRATGELLGVQNSDDYYYPGSFEALAEAARTHPEADVFYGDKDYVDIEGRVLFTAWAKDPHDFANMIPWPCAHSEVLFFRRRIWEEGFRFNEARRHYLDYEFFWDLLLAGKKFLHVPGIRAGFRQHPQAKTSRQGEIAQREAFEIYLKVWASQKIDARGRRKLLRAMQDECRNDFAAERWELFRKHVRELEEAAGSGGCSCALRLQRAMLEVPEWMRLPLLSAARSLRRSVPHRRR